MQKPTQLGVALYAIAALILRLTPAQADARPADALEPQELTVAEFEASLNFQQGQVIVGDGLATLELGDSLHYLDASDSARLLAAWGNPPGAETLGMIFPRGVSPFADESWGVVITYEEDGHVEDEDAGDIDYDELLETMKEASEEANQERISQGYQAVHLVGWAEQPHYDAETKKLYWAKELDFGETPHTLNYAIRVLGRKGVLQLNAVASITQLPKMRTEMPAVLGRIDFNEGNRYEDFDPDLDEVAAYGIGALVAGKVAAKVGLFKGLLALLLASKKLVIGLGVALLAGVKGLLSGRGKAQQEEGR